jgi:hypothetical protein
LNYFEETAADPIEALWKPMTSASDNAFDSISECARIQAADWSS